MAMIIACPQCTTRYTVDGHAFRAPGRTVRCTTCDHTWFQAPPKPVPAAAQGLALADGNADGDMAQAGSGEIESETARMVAAARQSAARFRDAMARRRGHLREWSLLVVSVALFVVGGLALRETAVRLAPGTAAIYAAAGLPVNVRGLELRNVGYDRQYENGVFVLSIKGEVVNIRDEPMSVPKLRFGLRDGLRQELYHWNMKVSKDQLQADEAVAFVARVASPPVDAYEVEVRFARATETGAAFR
jgi:predicted Zn finger-like uncharacterized protein